MTKQLDQMSNEELGILFPIIISEPNSNWKELFEKEKKEIEKVLGSNNLVRLEHIGSTAIPNLKAKPSIDILLEISRKTVIKRLIDGLRKLKYHFIPKPDNPESHMMFVKGYTSDGFKGQAFHIHVRYSGDWDEPYFRDYLIQNPQVAKEYENLKIKLSKEFKNDREGYTDMKADFVKHINELARKKLK